MKGGVSICVGLLALYCLLAVKVQVASCSSEDYSEEGSKESCTQNEAGLQEDQLSKWISSASKQSNTTYIMTDDGSVFVGKSVSQAEDKFFSEVPGKVSKIWMNNSPCSGICAQKLIARFQKNKPTIYVSHFYTSGDSDIDEAMKCLAKMVYLKFSIQVIDWNKLKSTFTNVRCGRLIKDAFSSPKFNAAEESVRQVLIDVVKLSKNKNVKNFCV